LNDSYIRSYTLYFLLVSKKLNENFFKTFLHKLIEKDEQIIGSSHKFYINSMAHRERFRLWQSLLALLPKLNKSSLDPLVEYSEKNLICETQPSTRILMEWVLLRVILSKIETFDLNYFWTKIENFSNKKVGYTCSWLSILTQLAPVIPESKRADYVQMILPVILSQILSSNFHIRTFVEATLIKLYTMINEPFTVVDNGLNNPKFVEKIKFTNQQIYSIIRTTIDE
jgi:hypothetical protein